jgi:fructuronate reductase
MLKGVAWNDPSSYKGQLRPILANESLLHVDYTKTPLADRIEGYFVRLLEGPGAARKLLQAELA